MTLRALRCDGRVPRKSRYSRSGKPPLPDRPSRGRDRGFPKEQLEHPCRKHGTGCSKMSGCKAPEILSRFSFPNLTSAGARPGVSRGAIRTFFPSLLPYGPSTTDRGKNGRDSGSPRGSPRANAFNVKGKRRPTEKVKGRRGGADFKSVSLSPQRRAPLLRKGGGLGEGCGIACPPEGGRGSGTLPRRCPSGSPWDPPSLFRSSGGSSFL